MRIKPISPNFIMPIRSTKGAGAFDIYMPEDGNVFGPNPTVVNLGFAAEIPENHVALLLPRSGTGFKYGVELNNTCGVLDSDFRGEWKASIKTKNGENFSWKAGERILQFMIVPVALVELELTDSLSDTDRGSGGFGSTGQ